MKNYFKAYLWENGHKGIDLTSKLSVPIFMEDNIDETVATGEIILINDSSSTCTPKTKIRIEIYTSDPDMEVVEPTESFDMVYEADEVEELVGT